MTISSYLSGQYIKQIIRFGSQNYSPILQQKMNPIAASQLSQPKLKPIILSLKHTAFHHGLISLSANQININSRIFIIMKKKYLSYGKWMNYQQKLQNKKPQEIYDTIINPEIIGHSEFKIKGDQQCPSLEGMRFKVWLPLVNHMRYVKYLEEEEREGKYNKNSNNHNNIFINLQSKLSGFYSRVFDHQFRHLEGILPNLEQICNHQVYLTEDYKVNPQNYDFIKQYRLQRQNFDDENLEKIIQYQKKLQKQKNMQSQNNKAGSFASIKNKLDLSGITQKITTDMKAKLMKSYQQAKKQIQPMKNTQPKSRIQKLQAQKQKIILNRQKNQGKNKKGPPLNFK